MAHDVFLSYPIKDKTIADTVCAKLEENGICVWIAPRDVPPGSNFAGSIVDAIDICKVFVLIWSAEANVSKHILNEVNQAFDQGIIIPFRIQDAQPTHAMRYYIGHTHWLDATVGEMGFYTGAIHTAAVIAEEATTVYRLDQDVITKMTQEEPVLACGFHKWIAELLSHRLTMATRTIDALQPL